MTLGAHLQAMVKQAKTGLAVGIAKGHVVTVREQKQRPAQRKGVSASVQQRWRACWALPKFSLSRNATLTPLLTSAEGQHTGKIRAGDHSGGCRHGSL